MERKYFAERNRLRERMEHNVNDYRRNEFNNTHTTPQPSCHRDGRNEQYTYTRQDKGDRLNESTQQRQASYREENRQGTNTEGSRSTRNMEESP